MSNKLTYKEAMQALIDGEVLTFDWQWFYKFEQFELKTVYGAEHLDSDRWCIPSSYCKDLIVEGKLSIYHPPKEKKTVTLYRFLIWDELNKYYFLSELTSQTFDNAFWQDQYKLLKTETKEVEYEA